MKYLFGRVEVSVVTIETIDGGNETVEAALKRANEEFKKDSVDGGLKEMWLLPWVEGGASNTEIARNNVLGGFLELMTQVIPMTPYDKPRIILPNAEDPSKIIQLPSDEKR